MGLLKKGTKMYSIFKMKCPHCHEGDFYISSNPYNFKNAGDVHDTCHVCHRKLSKEPGFYIGAMYVAYGLGVAVLVSVIVATYVLFPEASTGVYIGIISVILFIAGPYLYALSKIIWANMFYRYKGVEKTSKELESIIK